jgi:predicted nucleotide-binding protein (sugar kinase/HSP70/actin superfamily)
MLTVAGRDGFNPNKAAFFMPGGSGPCRFGMYNCMHKLILKTAGFEGCKVISPNQDGSFYKEFARAVGGVSTSEFMKNAWTATAGVDLLAKMILRLRPFAKDKHQAQIVHELAIQKWIDAIEKRTNLAGLCELMGKIADQLAAVPVDTGLQKPRIGIVGEIYVRSHPFANSNIIARLEELDAACDLASLAEWIYYMNFCEQRRTKRNRQFGQLLNNRLRDFVQHRIERKLAEPLEKRFGRLAENDIEHTIELAKPYMDESFEGEAILSIGKTVEYHHEGFGGVVNVMPFTCMPSTIVSSQTMRISADCANMPILNLSFDGQEDVTLTTRLEAFVEQVASRQKSKIRAAEIIATK